MSFTIKVKEEIIAASSKDKAELSALIKMSGSVGLTNQGLTLSISTENAKIARHIYQLMESRYQSNPELRHHNKTNLKKNRVYTVFVADHVNDILSDLQLADSFFGFETGIETSVMEDDEAGRSYLRGAFLATGTVRDPEKGRYQLEIFSVYQDHAEDLASLMKKFMLDAKVLSHKNGFVTYLQKAEDIMDFLLVIGAMNSKDVFEEVKIMRETRNDLNRANNAETAKGFFLQLMKNLCLMNMELIILSRLWIRLAWRFYRWSCAKLPNFVLPTQITLSSRLQIV